MNPSLTNIRTSDAQGGITYFSGNASDVSPTSTIYNAPITGGFYSGLGSGYADALRTSNNPAPASSVTSSSGTARADEAALGTNITTMSSPGYMAPTSNTKYIDDYMATLAARRAAAEESINSSFDNQKTSLENQNTHETGSTSVGLSRMGGYLGGSASQTGVLQNLAETHKNDMLALESKRQDALNTARTAYEDKNFALATQKAADAKSVEQEAYTRQQAYFKQIADATKTAQPLKDQASIYNAIQGGAHTATDIYKALEGKVSMDDISSYLTKSAPAKSTTGFSFTNDDTAKLLGSGFSNDDITALHDYVNTNGYTDELRNSLTSKERTILDGIYYPKAPTGGVGGTLTIAEAKSLGLPPSLIGRSQTQVLTDLQSPAPPAWYKDYIENQMQANVTPEYLTGEWKKFSGNILGTFMKASGAAGAAGGSTPSATDTYAGY